MNEEIVNQTYLHMHDGEPVYYEDTCEVCEAEQIARDEMTPVETPEPEPVYESEVSEPRKSFKPAYRIDSYAVRDFFRTLVIICSWVGIVLLDFLVFSLLAHGTVKW